MLSIREQASYQRLVEDCAAFEGGKREFCDLVRRVVRPLIDFRFALAAIISAEQHRIVLDRVVGIDAPAALAGKLQRGSIPLDHPAVRRWADSAHPIVLDASACIDLCGAISVASLPAGYVALHGQPDISGTARTCFAFAGIDAGSADRVRMLLHFITPHLHGAFGRAGRAAAPAPALDLSRAEQEVTYWLLAYKSNKEIARILGKSDATVRNQLHAIFRKLRVRNRAAAIGKLAELHARGCGAPGAGAHRQQVVSTHLRSGWNVCSIANDDYFTCN